MTTQEDRLIGGARRGDHDAIGALFDQHWRDAWRVASGIVRSRETADEGAQGPSLAEALVAPGRGKVRNSLQGEDMADTGIRVKDNGPLVVHGAFSIEDGDGNVIPLDKDVVGLCRCGHSANKPFCDGSHKDAGFSSEVRAAQSTS